MEGKTPGMTNVMVLVFEIRLQTILSGVQKKEEAFVMLRKAITVFLILPVLIFGFGLSVAAFSFGGIILDDSGIGVRVDYLMDRSLLYIVPGYDWDEKGFCGMCGGEYYFTKDLILHLRYCDWPLDSTMRYNSTLVTRKRLFTAEAAIRQGKDGYRIGLSSGKLQTENEGKVGVSELALGYTRYISEDAEKNWRTVLVTGANFGWAGSGQEYLTAKAKLIFNKNNFTVATGVGHNTYSGRMMPCFDLGRILYGFPVNEITGVNMFSLTAERKFPLITVAAEDFQVTYSLPVFLELAGIQREEKSGGFALHNRAGLGFSLNTNNQVEVRLEAVLLDGAVSRIVFYAITEIY